MYRCQILCNISNTDFCLTILLLNISDIGWIISKANIWPFSIDKSSPLQGGSISKRLNVKIIRLFQVQYQSDLPPPLSHKVSAGQKKASGEMERDLYKYLRTMKIKQLGTGHNTKTGEFWENFQTNGLWPPPHFRKILPLID